MFMVCRFGRYAVASVLLLAGSLDAQQPPPAAFPETALPPPIVSVESAILASPTRTEPGTTEATLAPSAKKADAPGLGGGPGGGGPGGGGPGGGGMGGGGLGGGPPGYSVTWYPSRRVEGQNADLGMVRQSLSVGAPIWNDVSDKVIFNVSVRNNAYFTDAVLPESGRAFPAELWHVGLGANYLHTFDNGWVGGVMVNVGSQSDKPFHSIREINVGGAAFLRVPARNDRDSWMFSVVYFPASNLNFPIPGIAYVWKPSDRLTVNIGVPFSVNWRPTDDLTLDLSYLPLTNINARLTQRIFDGGFLYAGYQFLNESYFLADRVDSRDRFMGFEQRVLGGFRWDLLRYATLDLNAGYAFDRHYGEGRNQGSSLRDEVRIAPGAFVGLGLQMRF